MVLDSAVRRGNETTRLKRQISQGCTPFLPRPRPGASTRGSRAANRGDEIIPVPRPGFTSFQRTSINDGPWSGPAIRRGQRVGDCVYRVPNHDEEPCVHRTPVPLRSTIIHPPRTPNPRQPCVSAAPTVRTYYYYLTCISGQPGPGARSPWIFDALAGSEQAPGHPQARGARGVLSPYCWINRRQDLPVA